MKRSNLIILILVLLFPAGFLMHNLALRAAFYEAKAQPLGTWEGDRRYYRELPPFRHIVLEGGVRLRNGKKMRLGSVGVNAFIKVGPKTPFGMEYRLDVKPCLQTEVRNDTLFCWFEADNARQWRYAARNFMELTIKAPEIASIQTASTLLHISELFQPAPVALQVSNSYGVMNLIGVDVPLLDLKAKDARLHIIAGKIDTFRYELGASTHLELETGVDIGKKELVKADVTSSFTMNGVAADTAIFQARVPGKNGNAQ